jgi:tetratricopeptide (TPR) repeat protein
MSEAEVDAVLARAAELRAAGMYQEAIDLLTEAVQAAPCARLFFARGRVLDVSARDEDAVADYTRAIELDPTNPAYYYHRGRALSHPLDRDEEAVRDFERALELRPGDARAHRSCCLSYLLVGPPAIALTHAEAAVRLAPDDALSHFCLGQSLNSLKRDTDSLGPFLRAVELAPECDNYWSALAGAYERAGGAGVPELALAAVSRAIDLGPSSASKFLSRGSLLLKMGRPEEAVADLRHALTLDPNGLTRMLVDSYLERA